MKKRPKKDEIYYNIKSTVSLTQYNKVREGINIITGMAFQLGCNPSTHRFSIARKDIETVLNFISVITPLIKDHFLYEVPKDQWDGHKKFERTK